MSIIEKIIEINRAKIKKLAERFAFKYNKDIFRVTLLKKKELVLLNYLSGCPIKEYSKFGKNVSERAKRIEEFLNSIEFKNLSKQYGGCVASMKYFKRAMKKIKSPEIKMDLMQLLNKLGSSTHPPVISIPENFIERNYIFNEVLFHEWIHLLCRSNKINFQKKNKKLWLLDEGLTTYMQLSAKINRTDISVFLRHELSKYTSNPKKRVQPYRFYLQNALKFNNLLKDKKTPQERKNAVIKYLKRIS